MSRAKLDLMKRTKKGVAMFYVGALYWLIFWTASFADLDIKIMGLFLLIGAGLLFPIGILVSKTLNIDFFAKGNPLSNLAGAMGGMQILFAPILVLIYMERIQWLPFIIAILTGAHFFPFVTLYKSKGYFFHTFAVIIYTSVVGFLFMDQIYTILPLGLFIIYFLTSLFLNIENKRIFF
ncbi:DUF7010 family protein [Bacillus methanolicus]|uniref:DUF7010 family protein n=1 Tax=Bacillus methanolicus TaxID=1471 RepID=UPI003B75C90B